MALVVAMSIERDVLSHSQTSSVLEFHELLTVMIVTSLMLLSQAIEES